MAHALRVAGLLVVCSVFWALTSAGIPLCGFRWLTGLPCPLCGLTHSLFALAKGHVSEAVRLHALSPLAIVMLVLIVWNRPVPGRFWTGCASAFAIYGIARIVL